MSSLSEYDIVANILAIKQAAQACYPTNVVLQEITVCQAILESNLQGKPSELALKYNNLFGIKGEGTDGSIGLLTHEYQGGKWIDVVQLFAYNHNLEDSVKQHARLLALPRYENVGKSSSFAEAAHNIKQDGYATDPTYPAKLIEIYDKYYIKST